MTKIERIAVLESEVGRLLNEIDRLREQVGKEHRALREEFHKRMEAESKNRPAIYGPLLCPEVNPYKTFRVSQPFVVTCDGRMPT
jgi:hypothetical protein